MDSLDNTYSRTVAWLKIILPLIALAILSTMFLVSNTIEPSQTIPYADVDPAELAREQRIAKPNFSSVTSDGSAVQITAEYALPDPNNPNYISAKDVKTDIETADGTLIKIVSLDGFLDSEVQVVTLTGDVKLTTSTGFEMTTQNVQAKLDATVIKAPEAVAGLGPMGTITAGNMLITQVTPASEDGPAAHVVVFNDNVRLIYIPPSNKGPKE